MHKILDYHEAATPLFCIAMLLMFRPHNLTAYIFAALLSGDALITLVKELCVPESRFHKTATQGGSIGMQGLIQYLVST